VPVAVAVYVSGYPNEYAPIPLTYAKPDASMKLAEVAPGPNSRKLVLPNVYDPLMPVVPAVRNWPVASVTVHVA